MVWSHSCGSTGWTAGVCLVVGLVRRMAEVLVTWSGAFLPTAQPSPVGSANSPGRIIILGWYRRRWAMTRLLLVEDKQYAEMLECHQSCPF